MRWDQVHEKHFGTQALICRENNSQNVTQSCFQRNTVFYACSLRCEPERASALSNKVMHADVLLKCRQVPKEYRQDIFINAQCTYIYVFDIQPDCSRHLVLMQTMLESCRTASKGAPMLCIHSRKGSLQRSTESTPR